MTLRCETHTRALLAIAAEEAISGALCVSAISVLVV
jgi:hypothetical protein